MYVCIFDANIQILIFVINLSNESISTTNFEYKLNTLRMFIRQTVSILIL